MKFSEMTDEQLIEMAKALHETIYVVDCFSTRDLHNYEGAMVELIERDYVVNEETKLVIS